MKLLQRSLLLATGLMVASAAAAEAPLEARRAFARGVLEECRGRPDAALAAFEQALARDPEAWPLVERLAVIRQRRGDIESASTLYREMAGRHPERLGVQLAYADFLRDSTPGDDFAAKLGCEVLEASLQRHPGHPAIVRRLFRFYEQRGMRDESLALFDEVAGSPDQAMLAVEMARTLFPGDDEEARGRVDQVFEAALARRPADRVLARAASEHFRKSGRLDRAIEVLGSHVAADPASLDLRVRRGILMFAAGRDEEGVAVLGEVLEIDPGQALAHRALAKWYRRAGRVDEALPHAAELLRIRGGDAAEFVELAGEFLDADRPRDARLLLEKGLFDHPEDAAIAARLALASWQDPETRSRAPRLFREAEALSGDDGPAAEPEFLVEVARCLRELGQTAGAEDRLRRAMRAYPSEARAELAAAMRTLAGIWQEDGRNEAAARSLIRRAEALEESP